jgi:hypothetical protein
MLAILFSENTWEENYKYIFIKSFKYSESIRT